MKIRPSCLFPFVVLSAVLVLPAFGDEKEAVIGFLTELSGPFAENGADCREGDEIALDAFGVPGVRVVFGDTQGDGRTALNELLKLIDVDGISAFVANRSQVAAALNPISAARRIPYFAIAAHPDVRESNRWAYRIWPSARQEAEALAPEVLRRRHRRLSMIVLEDEYTNAVSARFKRVFEEAGGTVVSSDSISGDVREFTSLISRVRTASADALYVYLGIPQIGPFMRKLREQKVSQQVYTNFWMQTKEALQAAGRAADGVYFEDTELSMPAFELRVRQKYGKSTSPLHRVCFLAAGGILQAARSTTMPGPAGIFESLSRMKSIETLDAPLPLVDREAVLPLVLKTIQEGRLSDVPEFR